MLAKWRVSRLHGVRIAPSARLDFARLLVAKGGELEVGAGTIVEGTIIFDRRGSVVRIGDRTFVGGSTIVSADCVEIGNDVLISWGCWIVDHDSHALQWQNRAQDVSEWYAGRKDWTRVPRSPVRIDDRAWIGFNSIILKGVHVGEGAVVAAGSVVTRDVEPYTLVAGNPAREVRKLSQP
jgi:galactoside O-acetyltransferase